MANVLGLFEIEFAINILVLDFYPKTITILSI